MVLVLGWKGERRANGVEGLEVCHGGTILVLY